MILWIVLLLSSHGAGPGRHVGLLPLLLGVGGTIALLVAFAVTAADGATRLAQTDERPAACAAYECVVARWSVPEAL